MAALETYEPENPGPDGIRGIVLMLHGGAQSGLRPVDERSASWRRARWMARSIAPEVLAADRALWLLQFSVRGWNDPRDPSPVPDARWALDEVTRTHPDVPVVLLGHSMGARTAVRVADDPAVVGVVGLAPWFQADDPVSALRGRRLVAGHGSRDRITSARMTRAFVERAERAGADAEFVDLGRVGHYMLSQVARWNAFAAEQSLRLLGAHADCH